MDKIYHPTWVAFKWDRVTYSRTLSEQPDRWPLIPTLRPLSDLMREIEYAPGNSQTFERK